MYSSKAIVNELSMNCPANPADPSIWTPTPLGAAPRLPETPGPLHGPHAAADAGAEGTGQEDSGDEGGDGGDTPSKEAGRTEEVGVMPGSGNGSAL